MLPLAEGSVHLQVSEIAQSQDEHEAVAHADPPNARASSDGIRLNIRFCDDIN
jgi:hypothetical protein